MPTNEQRRANAKRKLERQIEHRAERERKRRLYTIIGSAVAAVVVIAAVVFTVVVTNRDSDTQTASASTSTSTPTTSSPFDVPPPADVGPLPEFAAPEGLGSNCQYPTAEPASKPNRAPRTGEVPTDEQTVSASLETSQGNIGLQLDNGKTPCTVNSFVSLAQQGYFDDTVCHRLTTSDSLGVLQCGDPTGEGTGGPGYSFADEYPVNQFQPDDPALQQPVVYPRGTLAMANAGPGTNGSQFFLVYKDSQLPPNYTVFGTIDDTGLATLDKVAAAGTADGGPDGNPKDAVTIKSLRVDP
ncbi:cyclophilin type peptidyl-prolyl cis-trans isomerase [Mycolicibacterium aurum]|uniref:Peptidyl-prolyl cis-trans isomerase n=1 Tax=Mycolicibacterium aurum TaxID=1791 RepID=A0A448IPK2_MYCAU|nr:peptidylprolyl isomerase [Mycolicibacterium aurum]VEG54351.1 cyclophilin type peptidyl-prolyl cis-trans isomerase [Mycolicibacterium aurum]